MKLNMQEKMTRKDFKAELKNLGGDLYFAAEEGVVVLVVPAVQGAAQFAHVAVAQCDLTVDVFKRKRGELLALNRWAEGETLSVPFNYRDNEELARDVLELIVG